MKLTVTKRVGDKKSDVKKLRRAGHIPAVLYAPEKKGEPIAIDGVEFAAVMRQVKQGQLSTTVFTLMVEGKAMKAIIKGIQYQVTNYKASHIDFEELIEGIPVTVKVPIHCTGVAECSGIKLGGFLRQVMRTMEVRSLPHQIPHELAVDVRDLGIWQSRRLSDLVFPPGVRPIAPTDEVIVVIAKR